MNKFLPLASIFLASQLSALDFDLDMGSGLYYTGAKGQISYVEESFKGSYANTDLQTKGQFYVWADLDTKNPYLPKLRLEYTKISTDGDSKAHLESANAKIQKLIDDLINGSGIPLNDQVWNSHLQHNIYDTTLFYEFFDKSPWPSVGAGLGYRYFTYIYIMDIDLVPGLQFGDRDDSGAPMIYFTSRYEAPALNMGFQGDGKVYVFGDSQMYDWQVKMDLMFEIDESTKIGMEIGYREQYYNILGEDIEKVTGNMSYRGLFVGGLINFK